MVLGGFQIPSGTKVVSAGMVISIDGDHFDGDVDDDVDIDDQGCERRDGDLQRWRPLRRAGQVPA